MQRGTIGYATLNVLLWTHLVATRLYAGATTGLALFAVPRSGEVAEAKLSSTTDRLTGAAWLPVALTLVAVVVTVER